jgi:hypothetical protein
VKIQELQTRDSLPTTTAPFAEQQVLDTYTNKIEFSRVESNRTQRYAAVPDPQSNSIRIAPCTVTELH